MNKPEAIGKEAQDQIYLISGDWDRSPTAWQDRGRRLALSSAEITVSKSRHMWEMGDWLVAGEDAVFRNLKKDAVRHMAAEISGYSRHTLTMAASVARKVEPSVRVGGLSWWHHLLVASLDKSEQNNWLSHAAEEEWSVHTFRAKLQDLNHKARRSPNRSQRLVLELTKLQRDDIDEELHEVLSRWWLREMA
jgi:hypothetical protein